ncbi:calphotin-like [Syngnathoides biaculeatus]|uniref:calphotin-like n=1 Tax=Syngnathoides biaculeatus TaxID=300417 RepID=UPI002ADD3D4D|nr:calphotin-like [Syngnathoides biaculeatus]XP_061698507.1 calphotin-like [Syngnathoides biaculeatus]XP_061698508.1 calphotin-like [Syngnathoides biaculeatus]XP_061698509.1 calphotin-like [Syngnathoides biaculeatus]XP_061698510.1 calphotin-like [Syngnathoides biaculeatus]XP_061698511.1 calphotin-like [Syngnathoides biaculeatus]XP_061698512.1 calphotin-like [Syngnathoides biaculeatus]XP_061698513.1 calphotin-like [Syngnathoides biaculeatus]XP_061698515.1 calphotin-like [Syngnathoides biacul
MNTSRTRPVRLLIFFSDFSEYEEDRDLYAGLPEYDSDDFDFESLCPAFDPCQFPPPSRVSSTRATSPGRSKCTYRYEGTRLAIYPGPPRGGQRRRPGRALPGVSRCAATKTPSSHSSPATVRPADLQLVAKLPAQREEVPPNHEAFRREMRAEIERQSAELAALTAQVRQGLANQPSYADVAMATDSLLTQVHVAVETDPPPCQVHATVGTDSPPQVHVAVLAVSSRAHAAVGTDPLPRHAHVSVSTDSPPTQVHVALETDSPPRHAHVAVSTDAVQAHVAVGTDPMPPHVALQEVATSPQQLLVSALEWQWRPARGRSPFLLCRRRARPHVPVQEVATVPQPPHAPVQEEVELVMLLPPSHVPVQEAATGSLPSLVPVQEAATGSLPSFVPVQEAVTGSLPSLVPVQEGAATGSLPSLVPVQEGAATGSLPSLVPVQEGAATGSLPSQVAVHEGAATGSLPSEVAVQEGAATGSLPSQVAVQEGAVLAPPSHVAVQEGAVLAPPSQVAVQEGAVLAPPSQVAVQEGAVLAPPSQVAVQEGAVLAAPSHVPVQEGAVLAPPSHVPVQEGVVLAPPPSHIPVQEELGSSVEPPRSWRDFEVAVMALVLLSIIFFAPECAQPLQDLGSLATNPWSSCNDGVGGSRPEQWPASFWFLLRRLVPHRGRPPESPRGDPGAWRPGRPPDLSARTPRLWWPGWPPVWGSGGGVPSSGPPSAHPCLCYCLFFRLGTSGSRAFGGGGYCHDPAASTRSVRVPARLP